MGFLDKNVILNEILQENETSGSPQKNKLNPSEVDKNQKKEGLKKSHFYKNVDERNNQSATPETSQGISHVLNQLDDQSTSHKRAQKFNEIVKIDKKFGLKTPESQTNLFLFNKNQTVSQIRTPTPKETQKINKMTEKEKAGDGEEEKYHETSIKPEELRVPLDKTNKEKSRYMSDTTRLQTQLGNTGISQGLFNNYSTTMENMNQLMNHTSNQLLTPRQNPYGFHQNQQPMSQEQLNILEVMNVLKKSPILKSTENKFDQINDRIQMMSLNVQNWNLQNY